VILICVLAVWHVLDTPTGGCAVSAQTRDAKADGKNPAAQDHRLPPWQMGETVWKHVFESVLRQWPNDKGIGIQLAWSWAGWRRAS